MPIPGMKLENGIGIAIKAAKTSVKNPITLSAFGEIIKDHLGRKTPSILRMYGADLRTSIATTDLLTERLANIFGNFGAEYPRIICIENINKGKAIMLGKGGGNGMIIPKEKIIIARPKPIDSIASTKSRTKRRSDEVRFTTSSIVWVVIILF